MHLIDKLKSQFRKLTHNETPARRPKPQRPHSIAVPPQRIDSIVPMSPTTPPKSNSSNPLTSGTAALNRPASRRAKTITARNFRSIQIPIPEPLASQGDIRWLVGHGQFAGSQTHGISRSLSVGKHHHGSGGHGNELKGVRWRYDPAVRVIVVEGRSEVKLKNAAEVFRDKIAIRLQEIGVILEEDYDGESEDQ